MFKSESAGLRNEDDGGQRRRLRKNDAAPRDGLGGQTSTVELLRRIRRQKRCRMRTGRPERACGADLVRCALLADVDPGTSKSTDGVGRRGSRDLEVNRW
jgi:uncharacterized protein YjhX (UPF0386 family)